MDSIDRRHRRTKNWWEPIYNPSFEGILTESDWDFSGSGPTRALLSASKLNHKLIDGVIRKFADLTFDQCDFQGRFAPKPSMGFVRCRFNWCDFAFSEWECCSFTECIFESSSLAMASFKDCEFRKCSWERMGFSGNRTKIENSVIMDPAKLIAAGFSGVHMVRLDQKRHRAYQDYRLEGTKAHLARTILLSHETVGDEEVFYQSARLNDSQQARYRVSSGLYDIRFGDETGFRAVKRRVYGAFEAFFGLLEKWVLSAVGSINGWGASIARPIILFLVLYGVFGIIYKIFLLHSPIYHPWQKSFDICTLAGYGNEEANDQPTWLRVIEDLQVMISIFLYTVFFSTVIARLSRPR
jgi:hypothetical protein